MHADDIFCHIDSDEGGILVGWGWQPSNPETRLSARILLDGIPVATVPMNELRQDLLDAGIGDGRYGFRYSLAIAAIPGGAERELEVVIDERDTRFLGFPRKLFLNPESPEYYGAIDSLDEKVVAGWVLSGQSENGPTTVELAAGRSVLQSVKAELPRADLNDRRCGFQFSLDSLSRESLLVLERETPVVRIAGTQTLVLPSSAFVGVGSFINKLRGLRYEASLHVKHGCILTGTLIDRLRPEEPVEFVISKADGSEVVRSQAALAQSVIFEGVRRILRCGFHVELAAALGDGSPHALSIAVLADKPIPVHSFEIDGSIAGMGFVERFSRNRIGGWAFSFLRPGSGAQVEVWVGDRLCGWSNTERFRADVASSFGTSGFDDFDIQLQEALTEADFQNLQVRLKDSGMVLRFTPGAQQAAQAEFLLGASANSRPRASVMEGSVDKIDRSGATGWALNAENPSQRVTVHLMIDDVIVGSAVADAPRPDVGREHGTDGKHGFAIGIPAGLGLTGTHKIVVTFSDKTPVPSVVSTCNFDLPGLAHPSSLVDKQQRSVQRFLFKPVVNSGCSREVSVAVVLLNLNGEKHLRNFFSSFHRFNSYRNYRIVVVDHGSSDQSQIVCQDWATKLKLTYIQRGGNDSFSASNNLAVDQCSEDLILFINNDVTLVNCILSLLVPQFDSERVGAVGIKLRSPRLSQGASASRAGLRESRADFVQHLGIKFDFLWPNRAMLPYELPLHPHVESVAEATWSVPAVTAAAMMVRRIDFLGVGGFNERYYYGYEDVDFCLALRNWGKEIICANHICALHSRGATRTHEEPAKRERFGRNREVLETRFGAALRQESRREALMDRRFLRLEPFRIAFAVSGTKMDSPEGDFFTAYEIGEYLVRLYGWDVQYLSPGDWYNLDAFDAVVAMRHDFNPGRIATANSNLMIIAWARNWFDAWLRLPHLAAIDVIWAGSERSAQAFRDRVSVPVDVLRLATNEERFQSGTFTQALASDYCFTGSYFDSARDLLRSLDPSELPHHFAVFGHNWDKVSWLAPFWRGPLPYTNMPSVYRSTRIVLDDANFTVKPWGSVNSRVYDALAAGSLVITNGEIGAEEIFDGLLPIYKSPAELRKLLDFYLHHEEARRTLAGKLKAKVLEQHTYRNRARQVYESLLRNFGCDLRYSVRLSPPVNAFSHRGGEILRDELRRQGAIVRGSSTQVVEASRQTGDDVAIFVTEGELREAADWPHLDKSQINVRLHLGKPGSFAAAEATMYDLFLLAAGPENELSTIGSAGRIRPLFESDDQEKVFHQLRNDKQDAQCTSLLRQVLRRTVPDVMRTVSELNQRRTKVTHTERKRDTGKPLHFKDQAGLKGRAELLFYPDYTATNPYQKLLYEDFSDYFKIQSGDISRALSLQARTKDRPVAFHLHWTSVIVGATALRIEAATRAESFLRSLRLFVSNGGRFFWTIHNILPHEANFPHIEIELRQALAQLATLIHVHSNNVPELTEPYYSLPAEKLIVAPHGNYVGVYPDTMDCATSRQELGITADDHVFLFFGQLRSYKGLDELITSFTRLREMRPNVHLIIAGEPYSFETGELRQWASETPSVTLALRRVPDEEIQLFLRAADFMVLPYRKVLTSGTAHLALSFGLPLIAPDKGLFTEMLRDGSKGVLYSAADPHGLLHAMLQCTEMDRDSIALQRSNISLAAKQTSWEETRSRLSGPVIAATVGRPISVCTAYGERRCFVHSTPDLRANKPTVAVVVLHYAHVDDTLRCVSALLSQSCDAAHIYIVSNDQDGDSFALLARLFPGCTIVQAPENLGYAGGNNLVLSLPEIGQYRFVWILNPDVVVPQNTLERLIQIADSHPEVSVFGVKIMFGDRPEKVWFGGGKIQRENGFETKHLYIGQDAAAVPPEPFACDYVTGASLFFRRSLLTDVGLLPEQYFLYFEETHWCMLAKSLGHRIMMFPEVYLYHHKRSENRGLMSITYLYYFSRNLILMSQRFTPDALPETIQRLRKIADIWTRTISEYAPARWKTACDAVERGVSDGVAGVTGKVDLSDLLVREQLDIAAATEAARESALSTKS